MSVMSSQKRKIAKKYKERMSVIRAAFKSEEYMKHRPHQKQVLIALNRERNQEEDEALAASR